MGGYVLGLNMVWDECCSGTIRAGTIQAGTIRFLGPFLRDDYVRDHLVWDEMAARLCEYSVYIK